MFSFFSGPETHPKAKSMAEYYAALAAAIVEVRKAIPGADNDPAFKQAADTVAKITSAYGEIESIDPQEAKAIHETSGQLFREIGTDGIPDIKGEASKLFSEKYNRIQQDLVAKKYWPVADCPSYFGQSYLTVYAGNFSKFASRLTQKIKNLTERVAAYDKAHQPAALKI